MMTEVMDKRPAKNSGATESGNSTTPPAPAKATYKETARDKAAVERYRDRERKRPEAARIKVGPQKGREVQTALEPATGDCLRDSVAGTVAAARLSETFGGVTYISANLLTSNLMNATRTKDGVSEQEVNAALSLVAEIAPHDGIEAMLAVQMVNAHGLICELQRRMRNTVENIPQQDSNGALLVKMLRTFTAQVETLKRYRTGGEQRVSVTHQHVTVNADKAAVAVNAPGGPGATVKTEERPDEPRPEQLAYAPLPSALETHGAAVPEPGR
jgi:hypothetical protein